MTEVRYSSDELENEFLDIISKGTMIHPSGVVDIGLPSRFVTKCIREGFESARVMHETLGTLDPKNINTPSFLSITEKLEKRVAEYLCSESGYRGSPDTTPYPEMAKDIVQMVFGVRPE